ncbi:hypothetical protein [Litoribacillus peritrichatus]|uniref:Uncharacterized protein n=1 Tax=Litoribacillus peritrichatus TaxID=718191 RepID=A0ABP7MGN2_9GAMM
MKQALRKVFKPVLDIFENDEGPFEYKALNRKILVFISSIFFFLMLLVIYLIPENSDPGYYIPVVVFGCLSSVGLIVGLLGTDKAVAKIWNNR